MTNEEAISTIHCAIGSGCSQTCNAKYRGDCTDADVIDASKMAIKALEKADKYRWHDLRKNPNDLPEINYDNRKSNDVIVIGARGGLNIAYRHLSEVCDAFYTKGNRLWSVIAWREIEPFEEVSE